jgi:sulfiredoxin
VHVGVGCAAGSYTTAKKGPLVADIPLEYIRRPLLRTRNNDPEKVKQLMESIAEIGLQEPVSFYNTTVAT